MSIFGHPDLLFIMTIASHMPLVASSRFGVNKRQILMELNRNAICKWRC